MRCVPGGVWISPVQLLGHYNAVSPRLIHAHPEQLLQTLVSVSMADG